MNCAISGASEFKAGSYGARTAARNRRQLCRAVRNRRRGVERGECAGRLSPLGGASNPGGCHAGSSDGVGVPAVPQRGGHGAYRAAARTREGKQTGAEHAS